MWRVRERGPTWSPRDPRSAPARGTCSGPCTPLTAAPAARFAARLPPLLTAPPLPQVLDQDTDAIAVHVVKVLTCVMSGSPSAKVRSQQG